MHRLPYVATLSRGACQGVLHQQLEEPNCVTGTGVGLSPSSHPVHNRTEPLCSNLVWWTTTSSSITPDQSHSFRGHCVRAYCKCSLRRRQQKKKKSLEKLQNYKASAIVQFLGHSASVCVSHLSLVCGGGWVRWEILDTPPAPRHLPRKSSVPLSFSFSFSSPIGDIRSPRPSVRCAAHSLFFFFLLCFCLCFTMSPPLSLPHPLTVWLSSSTPSSLPSLDSADELLLFHFPGISLCQAVWRQNT